MKKNEFIEFIKELGFSQTWETKQDHYTLDTDLPGSPNTNYFGYFDLLIILINDDSQLVQLSLSQMSNQSINVKNFSNFSLKTFGQKDDFQLELFLNFILRSFNEKPDKIVQFMRDKKIKNILK
jgi:hypothetical protein